MATLLSKQKVFEGFLCKYTHESASLKCTMKFNVFIPPQYLNSTQPRPALLFLSGLTCTEDNFMQKAGALSHAAKLGLTLITPDTSPRGVQISGQDDSWDFGSGAGFYVDATVAPWSAHYNMYTYILHELLPMISTLLYVDLKRVSVCGHSMGGHGALMMFLRNPELFCSVSTFAPICHPMQCAWGRKAFGGYLGEDEEHWKQYDATWLAQNYQGPTTTIFVDQGLDDTFLKDGQLLPDAFITACQKNEKLKVEYRPREGYDHGYYYISTFIQEHLVFHGKHLSL
jgi:S-formylglutathione hydrolase